MHKSYIAVDIWDSQCMRRDIKNISQCIQIVFFWTAGTFFSGKRPKTIYRSLSYLNWKHKNGFRIISGNPRQFNYRDESANCAYLHS